MPKLCTDCSNTRYKTTSSGKLQNVYTTANRPTREITHNCRMSNRNVDSTQSSSHSTPTLSVAVVRLRADTGGMSWRRCRLECQLMRWYTSRNMLLWFPSWSGPWLQMMWKTENCWYCTCKKQTSILISDRYEAHTVCVPDWTGAAVSSVSLQSMMFSWKLEAGDSGEQFSWVWIQ